MQWVVDTIAIASSERSIGDCHGGLVCTSWFLLDTIDKLCCDIFVVDRRQSPVKLKDKNSISRQLLAQMEVMPPRNGMPAIPSLQLDDVSNKTGVGELPGETFRNNLSSRNSKIA